jgi:hypothetical protein
MKKIILVFIVILSVVKSFAQDVVLEKYTAHNKGKWFIFWGGNRDVYAKSDIRFTGKNYDFTIQDAVADDKPKGWHIDYINPARMTIPQTNLRIGYYISDKYNVSIGVDHMKYVVRQNQTFNVNGTINLPSSEVGAAFNGTYNNTPIVMTENFLKFEHTDGLNYVHGEIARVDDISKWFKLPNTDKVQINFTEGLGFGFLYPRTDSSLLGKARHDDYHVAGVGISAKAGLNFTFFKYFFLQTELKGGYINMYDIKTTFSNDDKATQNILFFEKTIAFGGIFRL